MKVHLSIGILLLICAQCAHSAAVPVKRQEVTAEEALANLNAGRQKLAEAVGIANMRVMVYDKGYEEMARSVNCENPTTTGDYAVFIAPSDAEMMSEMQKIQNELGAIQNMEERKKAAVEKLFQIVGGFFIPALSKIGCAQKKCGTGVCVMGPLTEAKSAGVQFKSSSDFGLAALNAALFMAFLNFF